MWLQDVQDWENGIVVVKKNGNKHLNNIKID